VIKSVPFFVILNDKLSLDLSTRPSDCITDKYLVHARESMLHLGIIPDFFNGETLKL